MSYESDFLIKVNDNINAAWEKLIEFILIEIQESRDTKAHMLYSVVQSHFSLPGHKRVCCSSAGVREGRAGLFLYLLMTIRFLMDLSWVWYRIEWTLLFLLGIYNLM